MPSNVLLPHRKLLEIQEGGAGASNWKGLGLIGDVSQVSMAPIDSSEVEITRYPARDERTGRLINIDSVRSGTPLTYTTEITVQDGNLRRLLESLDGKMNLRIRNFGGEYSVPTNYQKMRVLSRAWNKKPSMGKFANDMVNSFDGYEAPKDPQRRSFPFESDDAFEVDPVVPLKISGTVTAQGISDVISVGYPRYAGQIAGENQNNPGNKEYLFITLKDGSNLPHIHFTLNKGASWVDNTGTGLTNFDGSGIAKCGALVVISGIGAGGGLAYAEYEAVKAGTATWTRSTNIAAGTVINAVRAIDSQTLIACGAAGAVYISTDGGRSFVSAGGAVTANALTKIAVVDSTLQWIAGASGTLIRRYKDVMSVVAISGFAVAINSLVVPTGLSRGTEVFVGGADGTVRASVNGTATTPTFSTRRSGASAVDAMAFAGPDGDVLYIAESNGSSQSRLVRDLSGGMFGNDAEILGSYTDPANSTYNQIAAADVNTAMVIGDVNTSQGFIGLVA